METKNLRELLDKVKNEKALHKWHFHMEDLLEAMVEELENKNEK